MVCPITQGDHKKRRELGQHKNRFISKSCTAGNSTNTQKV